VNRYLFDPIREDLDQKMVLLMGPRQVGKTTLAQALGKSSLSPLYLNFDKISDRPILEQASWLPTHDYVVLDEIDRMGQWKSHLKGIFDTKPKTQKLLVTGSARLDTFRQSGESLAGRYFRWRLHPLSVKELSVEQSSKMKCLAELIRFGGFPEPFFSGSARGRSRWQSQYFGDVIREDILEFSRINELQAMRVLLELLRDRTGSPLSFESLSRDLSISPNTVKSYLQILQALHIVYLIYPHHKNIARGLSKMPKLYFYDWAYVDTKRKNGELSGAVFENLIACHLLKHIDFLNDSEGSALELHYIKTRSDKEIDFVVTDEKANVSTFIECKLSDSAPSYALKETLLTHPTAKHIQLVYNLPHGRTADGIDVLPASDWLAELSA
jgi:uncharacterized protein